MPAVGSDARGVTPAETARRWLAPLVAFLASSLGTACTVSLVDARVRLDLLSAVDARFVGWVGLDALICMATALVGLAGARRVGAGPPLALGAAASVFGLALGASITEDTQLALALPVLGLAAGGLLAGGLGMALELPWRWARLTVVAWAIPLTAAWPLLAWSALHHPSQQLRLTAHPTIWLLAPVALLIVVWSMASMLLEPDLAQWGRPGLENAWSGLILVVLGAALVAMLLGFAPEISLIWRRPLILGTAVLVVLCWSAVLAGMADRWVKLALLCVGTVAAAIPALVQLTLAVSDAGSSRAGLAPVVVMAGAAVAGAGAGWRWPEKLAVPALLLTATGAAAAWVVPDQPWWLTAAGAPLLVGGAATLACGLAVAMHHPAALRLVGFGAISALSLGLVFAIPVGWALTGSAPVSTDATRAVGRVFLGITVAATVLAAAYASILLGRLRSGPPPP